MYTYLHTYVCMHMYRVLISPPTILQETAEVRAAYPELPAAGHVPEKATRALTFEYLHAVFRNS
jgi:hypothetical protein